MPAPTCQFCGGRADVSVRTIGEALTPDGALFIGPDPAPHAMHGCVTCLSKHGQEMARVLVRGPPTLLETALAELELERTKKS